MDSDKTLFDISEPEDAPKKKGRKRKAVESAEPVRVPRDSDEPPDPSLDRFIARVDGHCECPVCGMSTLDLAEIRMAEGRRRWLVNCSFGCGLSWLIDPIPGLIESESRKESQFRFRHGMSKPQYAGKTIDEVSLLPGGMEYLRAQAIVAKDAVLKEAVTAWLLTHESCTDKKTRAGQG